MAADLCWWGMARALQTGDTCFSLLGNWSATEPVPATRNAARTEVDGEASGRNLLLARAGPADPVYGKGKQCFVSANPSTIPVAVASGIN